MPLRRLGHGYPRRATLKAREWSSISFRAIRAWVARSLRDLGLNIAGFLLTFVGAGVLIALFRSAFEKLLAWGGIWPALVFVLVSAAMWAMLFGLVRRKHLQNPEGKVLPLSAAGFLLGAALVWVYIFAAVSYTLSRLGTVEYAAQRPEDLLYQLTDAYAWHFLDLLPGLNITSALGWKSPVDLQGGIRGVLLVLFRVAVIYRIFAKGRQILKEDEPASART
jgi:hypothetical protein